MAKEKKSSPKELLKDALVPEEEQPYKVPENWIWVRMGSITEINPPKYSPENNDDTSPTSFVPMSAISEITGTIEEEQLREYKRVKKGYTSFIEEDVLFAKITPCMENGKVAIAQGLLTGFGFGSTEFYVLRPKQVVDNRYIYHIVRSKLFRSQAKAVMTGAVGQQRVPKVFLEAYPLALPPLPEQKRIVAKVESLMGKINKAKQLIEEARETFIQRRAAILAKAFRGELTKKWREANPDVRSANNFLKEIEKGRQELSLKRTKPILGTEQNEKPFNLPPKWTWSTMDALIHSIQAGKNFTCLETPVTNGNVGLVKISAVTWGKFDSTETKTVNDLAKVNKEYFIRKGDFLISRANTLELVGASVIVDDIHHEIMISDKVWRVKFFMSMEKYINYYLKSIYGRKEIEKKAKGNQLSMRNISQESFRTILVPIPPKDEQDKIVRVLGDILKKEEKVSEIYEVLDQFDRLDKVILLRAFSGELSTNDRSEESILGLLKDSFQGRIGL